jgi:hypothetical protein
VLVGYPWCVVVSFFVRRRMMVCGMKEEEAVFSM